MAKQQHPRLFEAALLWSTKAGCFTAEVRTRQLHAYVIPTA